MVEDRRDCPADPVNKVNTKASWTDAFDVPPIPRSTFTKRLRRLDRESFIGFVSALWQARGYDVDRDGELLRVTDGATSERLWVHHTTWPSIGGVEPPDGPVDIVVSNRASGPDQLPDGSPTVIPADELRDIALYAIDRPTRDRLFEQYLGRSPVVEPDRSRPVGPRGVATVLAVGLGALILVGTAVSMGGPTSIAGITTEITGVKSPTPVEPSTERQPDEPSATPTRTPDEPSPNTSYPPGVASTGITNAELIADRHARLLVGRSYELVLTYREVEEDQLIGAVQEIARVQGPTVYASEIQRLKPPIYDPSIIAETAVYADGQRRITEAAPNRSQPVDRRSGGEGPFTDRVETYLGWYLTVEDSAVVDRVEHAEHTYYWIRLGNDPWPGLVDSSGQVLIDDRGIVRYLRVTYHRPDDRTRITVEIRYTDIGDTTVEPPEWYNESRALVTPVTKRTNSGS